MFVMLNSFQHLVIRKQLQIFSKQILRSFQDLRMTVGRSPIKRVTYMVILSEAKNLFEENHFVGQDPTYGVLLSRKSARMTENTG